MEANFNSGSDGFSPISADVYITNPSGSSEILYQYGTSRSAFNKYYTISFATIDGSTNPSLPPLVPPTLSQLKFRRLRSRLFYQASLLVKYQALPRHDFQPRNDHCTDRLHHHLLHIQHPCHPPTSPQGNPLNSPTRKPTTTEKPFAQPTPAPKRALSRLTTKFQIMVAPSMVSSDKGAMCAHDPKFVDPVSVHASRGESPSSDFACYDNKNLLVFLASTAECESRAEIVLDECTDQYLPYPRSFALGSEQYDNDDDGNGNNDGALQRDLVVRSDVRNR